jgi:hypothetical protein
LGSGEGACKQKKINGKGEKARSEEEEKLKRRRKGRRRIEEK